jgi:hypothetical protein
MGRRSLPPEFSSVLSILAAAAVLAFADPTPVAEGHAAAPAPAAAAAAPAKPKAPERVCWDEAPTGSHFTKRYCATREELERRAQQDKDALGQNPHQVTPGGFKPN